VSDEFGALAVLGEPVRRELYRFVAAAGEAVGREAAAEAVGVSRALAAFHLDKRVEAGLLEAEFRRLSGRSGPGAGRPAKLYRRTEREHAVSLPPRAYDAAARVLAEVVENAGLDRELQSAARAEGARRQAADPAEALRERGYEPFWDGPRLRLRNCPYHALAEEYRALICGMNLALVQGLAPEGWSVAMDARPGGGCCVALSPPSDAPSKTKNH
jgi:predicted ArsR family transcriptional regulator